MAMYSSSLNVYHIVSHVRIIIAKQELSNNPNRFAIRDPRGGNCGEVSKCGKTKNSIFQSNLSYFYFETFLSPDISGFISGS